MYTHTYILSIHIHTYVHIYIPMYTHIYIYTHIQSALPSAPASHRTLAVAEIIALVLVFTLI